MFIDHIGIAVDNLETAVKTYEQLLNTSCYKREVVESEKIETAFLRAGESKIELLASLHSDSVLARFLKKKGEGIHHIAFEVDNIEYEIHRLKKLGFEVIHDTPKKGADNKRIVFLHPNSNHGVLVELCESLEEPEEE
ncbi:MAG: methylmalonyl-CoA epimerase [Balneolaceae bacterium]